MRELFFPTTMDGRSSHYRDSEGRAKVAPPAGVPVSFPHSPDKIKTGTALPAVVLSKEEEKEALSLAMFHLLSLEKGLEFLQMRTFENPLQEHPLVKSSWEEYQENVAVLRRLLFEGEEKNPVRVQLLKDLLDQKESQFPTI